MKIHLAFAVAVVGLSFSPLSHATSINPPILTLKNWLTFTGSDGLENGMRKEVCYTTASKNISAPDTVTTFSDEESSSEGRTLKFLAEYYLQYRSVLSATEKDALYNEIKKYMTHLFKFRKYFVNNTSIWGWNLSENQLTNANLETGKAYTGAVATTAGFRYFTSLGNAFVCEGMVAAYRVASARGDSTTAVEWRQAAKNVGDFLCLMASPYDYYKTHFGADCMVDVDGTPIRRLGMVYNSVSENEALDTECAQGNLFAILPLKDLADVTSGTDGSRYIAVANSITYQMCKGLQLGFMNSFFPKYQNSGSNQILRTNENEDNAWHPRRILIGGNTYTRDGDDQQEYAFHALWQYYDLNKNNLFFTYTGTDGTYRENIQDLIAPFQAAPAEHMLPIESYDSCIAFTGMFNWKDDGINAPMWTAYMPYYDMVGFGLLIEMRLGCPNYHAAAVDAYSRVVQYKIIMGPLTDLSYTMCQNDSLHPASDVVPYWTTSGTVPATSKSSLVSVSMGLAILRLAPYAGDTVSP